MHPLRKLRESGNPTPAQVSERLAENIVFNSPILVRPIEGREVIAAIFAQSSSTRGSGTYTTEFKLDERTTFKRSPAPGKALLRCSCSLRVGCPTPSVTRGKQHWRTCLGL
jgi:hypothetical protein